MRDNFVVAKIADYLPHGCDNSSAVTLRVDSPVHQALKRVAKRTLGDAALIHPYLKTACTGYVILTERDARFITRLIKCYINDNFGWKEVSALTGDRPTITLEDINRFIRPLRMMISGDVDINTILDDDRFMWDQQQGCIDKLTVV